MKQGADGQQQMFAERLKLTRERQRLTQTELAKRSKLTPAAISQLEAGLREPTFSTIVRLAGALKTTPNDLIGIGGEEQLDPSLQGMFRDVKGLSKDDAEKVQAFVNFLAQQGQGED